MHFDSTSLLSNQVTQAHIKSSKYNKCLTGPLEAICRWSGPAGCHVSGEAANNLHEAHGKILDLASQEALSLNFSFKLGVTITGTLLFCLARNLKFENT